MATAPMGLVLRHVRKLAAAGATPERGDRQLLDAFAERHGEPDAMTFYTRLLLGTEPTPAWRERLQGALDVKRKDDGEVARRTAALILAMPEAQLA